jgi:hypothetical protein
LAKHCYPTGRSLLAYDSSLDSPGGWRLSMRCDINNPERYDMLIISFRPAFPQVALHRQ